MDLILAISTIQNYEGKTTFYTYFFSLHILINYIHLCDFITFSSQGSATLPHTGGIPARGVKSYELAKQEVKETTPLRESTYQPSL